MKPILEGPGVKRIDEKLGAKGDATNGAAYVMLTGGLEAAVIFSSEGGWDHVSVTLPGWRRTPTWEEMSEIKARFFEPGDCVVQYHPPADKHVNRHPFCLHLWRWQGGEFPQPPTWMVG